MFHLALIYDETGKRYVLPFELVEKYVDKETVAKIKAAALREIQKQ
jgi:hypothetical protein